MKVHLQMLVIIKFLTLQVESDSIVLRVKSEDDNSSLGFFRLEIYEENYSVKDTIGDVYGVFKLNNCKNVKGVVIKYAGHYSTYVSIEDLKVNPTVILKYSRILKKCGGMCYDSIGYTNNIEIEKRRLLWNKSNLKVR